LLNALFFIVSFADYFCLTNLTLHSGYKTFKKVENYDSNQCKMKIKQHQELTTLKDLLIYKDYVLIVASYGFLNYISVTIELNSMTISLYEFHWSMGKLSIVVLVSAFTYLVMFTLLGRNMFKNISTVYLFFVFRFVIYWLSCFFQC